MVVYRFHEDTGFPKNWEEELQKAIDLIMANPFKLSKHVNDEMHVSKIKSLGLEETIKKLIERTYPLDVYDIFEYYYAVNGTSRVTKIAYHLPEDKALVIAVEPNYSLLVTIMNPKFIGEFKYVQYDKPDEVNAMLDKQNWMTPTQKIAKRIDDVTKEFSIEL